MVTVEVRGDVLKWAEGRSGLDRANLLEHFPRLELWERGEARPTLRQLEAFAARTRTPFGYLLLAEPPQEVLPIPDFRTVRDRPLRKPSPDLLETLHDMQRRQGWMRDFLVAEGVERLGFVGSASPSSGVAGVARSMREVLRLGHDWAAAQPSWSAALRWLAQAAEEAGILVVVNGVVGNNTRRKLDPDEFQGFAMTDEWAPLVFVNGADFKGAQMFTLAHELAHVWLGQPGLSSFHRLQPSNHEAERFSNAVAAELLVPEQALRAAWRGLAEGAGRFEELARRFKVSRVVAARRTLDLGLVSRDAFFDFYDAWAAEERSRGAERESGGNFYATQNGRVGRRFAQAVFAAVQQGKLLYSEAYRLTGLHGATFDRYMTRLGF
jgi:Zn-dependent peptidase ImmA (M78 family)